MTKATAVEPVVRAGDRQCGGETLSAGHNRQVSGWLTAFGEKQCLVSGVLSQVRRLRL
jgi:hypothetical protein